VLKQHSSKFKVAMACCQEQWGRAVVLTGIRIYAAVKQSLPDVAVSPN
jgi:hypothetical protein